MDISTATNVQSRFAAALFEPSAPVPAFVHASTSPRAEAGFAVYRNNVVVGLIKAIGQRFPVIRRLAGGDSFDAVAHRYILTNPPRSPILLDYGEDFPVFVRGLGDEAMFDYLADIAQLEWLRGRAYHSADSIPVPRGAFAALSDRLDRVRVQLHPSAFLLKSKFPVVTIWESSLDDSIGSPAFDRWSPECALVVRPYLDVQVWRLPAATHAFFEQLRSAVPLAEAAASTLAGDPEFDLAGALTIMIESNVVVGITERPLV
jgi:hypothetical protein